MNGAKHEFDQIEDYLKGNLDPLEKQRFEMAMETDPALSDSVKQHRVERAGVELIIAKDLKGAMETWERDFVQATPSTQPSNILAMNWRPWAVAASVAILITAGWWFTQTPSDDIGTMAGSNYQLPKEDPVSDPKQTPKNKPVEKTVPLPKNGSDLAQNPTKTTMPEEPAEKPNKQTVVPPSKPETDYAALANTLYASTDFGFTETGISTIEKEGYQQAEQLVGSGQYSEAEKVLQKLLKLSPKSVQSKSLLAHTYYKNKQYDKAGKYFKSISGISNKNLAYQAQWVYLLTLMHQKPVNKTAISLWAKQITTNLKHPYRAQTAQVIQSLE